MHWDFAEWQYARDGTRVSAPYKRIGEGPTAWHPPLYCPSQRCCYWLASSTAAGHYSDSSPDAASSGSSQSSSSGQGTPMPECCSCFPSSTSSTSTVPGTRPGFSGL